MRILALAAIAGCGRVDFDPVRDADGDPSLIAYYPMDGLAAVPGTLPDVTGHGHDAACATGQCPTVVAGHLGNAMSFDGIDDIAIVPPSPELVLSTGLTISAWVRIGAAPGARSCFAGQLLGTRFFNSWGLCIEPSRKIFFYSVGPGSIEDYMTSGQMLSAGAWHHVAVTWDGDGKLILVDSIGTISVGQRIDFDLSRLTIGADIDDGAPIGPFTGELDDLRIYSRALSPAEVALLAP